MIARDAEAVSNDGPYKRIEIGATRDVDRRRDITEAMSGVGPTERDRIWRLVEQTARGVSAPAPDAIADEPPSFAVLGDEPLFLRRAE
jgi:hypothetical protein